jgi:outer membrane immunogenic protein
MKKALFSATAIALALTAGSTFAADLSRKEAPIYVPPPPPPMWTGFYVGLNAGGTWSDSSGATLASGPRYPWALG